VNENSPTSAITSSVGGTKWGSYYERANPKASRMVSR